MKLVVMHTKLTDWPWQERAVTITTCSELCSWPTIKLWQYCYSRAPQSCWHAQKGLFTYGTQGWQILHFCILSFRNSVSRLHINILSYFSYHSVQFQKWLCKIPAVFILSQAFSSTVSWQVLCIYKYRSVSGKCPLPGKCPCIAYHMSGFDSFDCELRVFIQDAIKRIAGKWIRNE